MDVPVALGCTSGGIEIVPSELRATLAPLTSSARLQEIVRAFTSRGLYDKWVLLHRAQLLVGVKLIALYGREEGGNCLQSDDDRAEVGELALAINSCYGPGLTEPNRPMGDLIAQLAVGDELYNLPLVLNGFVRTRTSGRL